MNLRILLIEDDAWLAESYAQILEKQGWIIDYAAHAISAMERIDHAKPDVIFSDVLLAGPTAMALFNELQSHADTKDIPVILCTNIADQLNQTDLAPYGVRRILDKATTEPDDLVAAIRSVI
ncbi:hypothetical protein B7Y94_03295 [Candidatus Saccharibacteria bacterium 32-49-12]|nr:MAG: hypothetical protein B7Y94_03295 [Candidatus Saccharibacteria bacterium 32-49-12]